MSESKIKVPDGMKMAAWKAACIHRGVPESLVDDALEAALRWLCPQIEALKGEEPEGNAAIDDVLKLFAAPEPEIPPEIEKVCAESFNGLANMTIGEALDEWPRIIRNVAIEAFNRGRRVGEHE